MVGMRSRWLITLGLLSSIGLRCADPDSVSDAGALGDAAPLDLGLDGGEPQDRGVSDLGPGDRGPVDLGEAWDAELSDVEGSELGSGDGPALDAAPADADPTDADPTDLGEADVGPVDSGVNCPIGWDDTILAELRVTADDDRRVVLNEVVYDDLVPSRTWPTVTTVAVPIFRHPSRPNVLAVRAENYLRIDGRDRGLLLQVVLTGTAAAPLVTDQRWRISTATAADWENVTFDDSSWVAPVEQIQHPGSPWGAIFGVSAAYWIWPYDSVGSAASKPVTERMLARRRFYLGLNGAFLDAPGACP